MADKNKSLHATIYKPPNSSLALSFGVSNTANALEAASQLTNHVPPSQSDLAQAVYLLAALVDHVDKRLCALEEKDGN